MTNYAVNLGTEVGCDLDYAQTMGTRLEELRAEYDRLINSMEFAYAMGHSRTLGRDPRLQPVIDRVDELRREIAALKQQEE